MNKKIKIILIIGVLAVIAAGFYVYLNRPQHLKVEKKELDAAYIPAGFPSTLPSEMGSTVLENFEASTPDGRKQYTRTVTTNKDIQERIRDFRVYFVNLGWREIENTQPNENTYSSLLKKDDNTLLISGYDSKANNKSVTISLTEVPKQQNSDEE